MFPTMNSQSSISSPKRRTESGRMSVRPTHIIAWLTVAAALFLSGVALGSSDGADAAPADGVYFGAYAKPRGNQTAIQATQQLESKLGSKLPLVRSFARWDTNVDNRFNNWAVDGDRRLMISVKPQRNNGQQVNWSAIANAKPGSQIHNEMVTLARRVKNLDGEVWMTFHHEPEAKDRISFGTNTDYKNAWRAFHTVFEQQNVSVKWVWTMTSWSFEVDTADRRSAGKWYPGDAYVDYLGADPYNWNKCRGNQGERWTELERVIAPFVEFADKHPDKQLVLPEFASAEGTAGQKAQWLDNARAYLKQPDVAARFAAVIYFHDEHPGTPSCNWWLDSSTATLNAAKRIAADPFFDRNIDGVAPPPVNTPVCTVKATNGNDVVSWTSQGNGWSYNVRRNDKWVGGTLTTSLTNRNVTSGQYVVIARGQGQKVTLSCQRA